MRRRAWGHILLLAIAFCLAVDAYAGAPSVSRDGGIWLQEDLQNGKTRDRFVGGVRNTGRLHVKMDDDGGEEKLTYVWSVAHGAPGQINFSKNNCNAAKDTEFTYQRQGWYTFRVKATDEDGESATTELKLYLDEFTCYENRKGRRIWYSMVLPQDPGGYDRKKKYPLLIDFHGGSPRGDRHNNQTESRWIKSDAQEEHPFFYISPGCPSKSADGKKYENWLDRTFYVGSAPMPEPATEPIRLSLEMLDDVVERFPVDEKRLMITGASNGGYATWDIICRHPRKFVAAMPICGGGDPLSAHIAKDVPIWTFHGDKDPYVPVKGSRNMIKYLRKAGAYPRYDELRGAGHNVWGVAWNHCLTIPWLFDETPPSSVANFKIQLTRGRDVSLSWDAAEDQECWIAFYRISRNGKEIGTTDKTSFSDESLEESMDYSYEVTAVSGKLLEGDVYQASISTPSDSFAPLVVSVTAIGDPHAVTILFSERVNKADAENPANYAITDGVKVMSATLADDSRSLILATSLLSLDGLAAKRALRVDNVRDLAKRPLTITSSPFEFEFDPCLAAHWRFDDAIGNVVEDSSSNNIDGTCSGEPEWVSGRVGGALQFDGVDDCVELGEVLKDVRFPLSVAVWIKWQGTGEQPVFYSSDIRDRRRHPGFWLRMNKESRIEAGFGTTRLNNQKNATSTQPLRTGAWVHVTTVMKNENDLSLFIDGQRVQIEPVRKWPPQPEWESDLPGTGWKDAARIGGRPSNATKYRSLFFKGVLDDLRIYARALTEEEIGGVSGQ